MFNWWSSLGTHQDQNVEKSSENPNVIEQNVEGKTGSAETSEVEQEKQSASELDYAKGVAKNVGDFLYSFASVATSTAFKVKDSVKDTVENQTIIGDFNKEQKEFVKEKHKRKEAAVPPWVGYNEEETMKNQILALSTDERNFLRDPPSGVPFHFESDSMFPVALATLKEDKNLTKMRFQLVPKKVSEERFWRNYFYRVSLIKQSTQLTSLAASGGGSSTGNDRQSPGSETKSASESSQSGVESKSNKKPGIQHQSTEEDFHDPIADSPVQHEFISDAFVHSEQELSREDLQQIGVERKQGETEESRPTEEAKDPTQPEETPEDIPEWEKELQAELQDFEVVDGEDSAEWEKEIEDMLGEEE